MSLYLMVWIVCVFLECALWPLTSNSMFSTKGPFVHVLMVLIGWFLYLVHIECTNPYFSYFCTKCRFGIVGPCWGEVKALITFPKTIL